LSPTFFLLLDYFNPHIKYFIGVCFLTNSQQLAPTVGQGSNDNQVSWVQSGILRSLSQIMILGYGR